MDFDAGKIIKTIAKCTFYIFSRTAGFGLLGLIANIVFLVILSPEMGIIAGKTPAVKFDGSSGPLAILFLFVIIVAYWPITLMLLGFGAGFPILFFIFGKKHGISKAIHYIITTNREFIMEYTVDRLMDFINRKTGVGNTVDAAISKSKLLEMLPGFLAKLDTMPRPLRLVYRALLGKIDIGGILRAVIEEQQGGSDEPISFEVLTNAAKNRIANVVEERLFAPSLRWFAILGGIDFMLFLAIKIAV